MMRTIIVPVKQMNDTQKAVPRDPVPNLPKRVPSAALFGPDRELIILHNGREYRLRLTQTGKLILTA